MIYAQPHLHLIHPLTLTTGGSSGEWDDFTGPTHDGRCPCGLNSPPGKHRSPAPPSLYETPSADSEANSKPLHSHSNYLRNPAREPTSLWARKPKEMEEDVGNI